VRELSTYALRASCERSRIEVLQILQGVDYPTASVILHLYHSDEYPILDFRAIWSLGLPQPTFYRFAFWTELLTTWRAALAQCRRMEASISPRDFDRALWQYSKENQPRANKRVEATSVTRAESRESLPLAVAFRSVPHA